MEIADLSATVAVLLAVSLATERLVAILKTLAPKLLAEEKKTDAQQDDPVADRNRRLSVQFIAFACAWATAAFLTGGNWNPLGTVMLGRSGFPAWIVGLLASGGSAFWAQVIGYTSALKDVRTQQQALEALTFEQQARDMGVPLLNSGKAVPHSDTASLQEKVGVVKQLRGRAQPPLPTS